MKEKNVIKICDYTSEIAVEERLNKLISNKLKTSDEVYLDFSGVKIILTAFLKSAIGSFIEKYGKEEFEKKIILEHLPQYSADTMEKIFELYKKSNRV